MNNQYFGFNNQNNPFKIPINNFQSNLLDIITQQVTNNIIGYINNSNNQNNTNFIIKNNNDDIKKNLSSNKKKEKNIFNLGKKNNNKDKTINSNCNSNISLKKRTEKSE